MSDGIGGGHSDPSELTTSADILDGDETILSNDLRFDGIFTRIRSDVHVPTEIVVSGDSLKVLDSGLLFCASRDNSGDLFNHMRATFGAEAANEIADVDEFARRIQLYLAEAKPHLAKIHARIQSLRDSPHPMPGSDNAMGRFLRLELDRQQPFNVDIGPVEYYVESRAQSVAAMPSVDPFRKPHLYEWQCEHLTVIRPYDVSGDLDIELPSVCDILRSVR